MCTTARRVAPSSRPPTTARRAKPAKTPSPPRPRPPPDPPPVAPSAAPPGVIPPTSPRRIAMPQPLLLGVVALLGLAVGSFLNVVIHRVPRGESLLRPGSHCPACGAAVRNRHNVPLFGWLLLR